MSGQLMRLLSLQDYNTRVVLLGTILLGISAGLVGVFMLLRKRALLGDVVSHATYPGIALAFIVMETVAPGSGKSLPGLLLGAALGGTAGVLATTAIRRWTRIKDDAALAVVLSIFFGVGVSLFTVIQKLPSGTSAGLSHFIYGKAASMKASDVQAIMIIAALILVVCVLLFKEFAALCFDDRFAAAEGWPIVALDLTLMGLVVAVSVIGLQSVGLLLVVAILIVPATSARFWTDRLSTMAVVSGALGGFSALGGVAISAVYPRVATGAIIVLVGAVFFVVSLLLGARRGIIQRWWQQWQVRRHVGLQHLLRAMYEVVEQHGGVDTLAEGDEDRSLAGQWVTTQQLQGLRHWSVRQLQRLESAASRRGWLEQRGHACRLTAAGAAEARRLVRNHRLWELYLIHFADVAPDNVDRNADEIEHVLDGDLLRALEDRLADELAGRPLPASPHPMQGVQP